MRKFFKKIKKKFQKKNELLLSSREIEWAHYYHDSIRGIEFIENLNLNIGRWAGNYTFFYLLNRILNDYQPKSIIEFGLGESSKFVSKYIEHKLLDTQHIIVEQSKEWQESFLKRFDLSKNTSIDICELKQIEVNGFKVNSYSTVEKYVNQKFDLYIVDGPFGSVKYSRYDIVHVLKNIQLGDEFIIIMDDYDRMGEKETTKDLISMFDEKKIPTYVSVYEGKKSVAIIATEKYRYTNSL
jgi:hypothetical protein